MTRATIVGGVFVSVLVLVALALALGLASLASDRVEVEHARQVVDVAGAAADLVRAFRAEGPATLLHRRFSGRGGYHGAARAQLTGLAWDGSRTPSTANAGAR